MGLIVTEWNQACEVDLCHTGCIQNFGAICFVSRQTRKILMLSDNLREICGTDGEHLGKSLDDLVPHRFHESMWSLEVGKVAHWQLHKTELTIIAQEKGCLLEFEPKDETAKHRLDLSFLAESDISKFTSLLLMQLQQVSGCERVLLYKFHEDGSGEVFAEKLSGPCESYLGLRYPKTDIPKVARDLYFKVPYRYISQVSSQNVALKAVGGLKAEEFSLGSSCLRSVSPFHLAYLKNMGVETAMSIPIIRLGSLWGLVSLHNRAPRPLKYAVRDQIKTLTNHYRMRLVQVASHDKMQFLDHYAKKISEIAKSLVAFDTFGEKFMGEITTIFKADSLVILKNGLRFTYGNHPKNLRPLVKISNQLVQGYHGGIFMTDCLKNQCDDLDVETIAHASGLLMVDIMNKEINYNIRLLLLKPEVLQTVTWGSSVKLDVSGLDPKNSFGKWKDEMRFHSAAWNKESMIAARYLHTRGMKLCTSLRF